MILIKIINVEDEEDYVFNFNKNELKYEKLKDRKLAYVSRIFKQIAKNNFFSISHSYPFCIMAESDNQIGIDIENVNRKIDWKSIVLKKFNKTDSHPPSRLDFLTIWTMREAYFKYSQDINYLAISITDIRRNCHWMCEHLDDVIYSICTKSQDDNIKYKILNLSNLYD